MATESKKIEVVITTEADERTLLKYEKAFKDLIDKLRKANPSFAEVQKRLKLLNDAMLVATDATKEQRAAWTQEIKVLRLIGKEYAVSAKMREKATKNAIMSEEDLDEAARKSMAAYRAQFKTIEAVSAQLKKLSLRISEARKESQLSDLQFSGRISLWNQEKHQLNEVRRELVANQKAQDDLAKAAIKASEDQKKAAEEAAEAQAKQGKSIARLIKQLVLWGAGSASLYYIWRKFRTTVINSVKGVYDSADSYVALTKEIKNTQSALVLFFSDYSNTLKLMEEGAKFLQHVAMRLGHIQAAVKGYTTVFDIMAERTGKLEKAFRLWAGPLKSLIGLLEIAGEKIGLFGEDQELLAAATATAQSELQEYNDALANATDEAKDYSSQISSLVSRMRDFNRAAAQQVEAVREIEQAFKDASAVARGQYTASLMQIDINLQKEITEINAKALEDRADAYKDYQDKLRDLQAAGNIKRKSDAERHALEMEFAQRRHNLSLIQNERLYQYSRGLLVAEGDVLAIEDLDARYKLERQAAEENFALQMQQSEAMFRLQARIQEESMRRQIAVIQQGLREQLTEIEDGRREEIAEAEAGAKEKEAQAADEQATALAAAMQAYQEDLKVQEEAQIEREQALADFLVDMGRELGVGYDSMLNIAKQYFDVGGSFDSVMKTEWERQASYIKIFTDAIWTAINALTVLGNKSMRSGRRSGPPSYGGTETPRLYAHGTDTIVSTPTPFIAGERGAERVVVQPLSPIGIGGNVSMSWKGGPIPIHGSGTAAGIDTAAMGDAIAQGIVDQMAWSFSSLRGSRGR